MLNEDDKMNTFADAINYAAQHDDDSLALVCKDTRLNYGELVSRCRRLGGALLKAGIRPGDRVAILAANSHQYIETYLTVPAAGLVVVPLNTRHAVAELTYALEDSGTRVLMTDQDPGDLASLVERVIRIPDEYEELIAAADETDLGPGVTAETLAGIFYTGGTTGKSKGVMLSHGNLTANTRHFRTLSGAVADDVFLVMAPLFHAAGSNSVAGSIWTGGLQVVLPAFDPSAVLDLIEREHITVTLGVPTMIAAICEEQLARPRDTSSVRLVAHGGSPIATEVVRRAHEVFPQAEMMHVYGSTETAPLSTCLRHEEKVLDSERSRSCGSAIPGVDIRITDDNGNALAAGEVGELEIRGPNVMMGYWNKPEQTAEVMRGDWYRSGDLGYMDDEGYIFLMDRAKDMIVSGGENVYCTEVEEALYKHPAVLQAAVFGVPDPQWGEAVRAAVVLREPVDSKELIAFCREHIAGYKVPKEIDIRDEPLPLSGPGKVLKRELRAPFWAGRDVSIG
jgi:long-chain acyl-CoA synthetase